MGRKFIECHEEMSPGGSRCHETIAADTEKELLELAGRHAINVHGAANTQDMRDHLLGMIKEG